MVVIGMAAEERLPGVPVCAGPLPKGSFGPALAQSADYGDRVIVPGPTLKTVAAIAEPITVAQVVVFIYFAPNRSQSCIVLDRFSDDRQRVTGQWLQRSAPSCHGFPKGCNGRRVCRVLIPNP